MSEELNKTTSDSGDDMIKDSQELNKILIEGGYCVAVEVWNPTMILKWFNVEIKQKVGQICHDGQWLYNEVCRKEKVLRQQWVSNKRNIEWRDIETE